MSDYLQFLCSQNKIKLIYTDNDYTILSSEISDDIPVLKAYHMFRNCPENIAYSILVYFINHDENQLKDIESYIDDGLFFLGYRIEPPDAIFMQLVNSNNKNKLFSKENSAEKFIDNPSELMEADIFSIIRKDFYGNMIESKSSKTLTVSSDDVTELNIIIAED